MTQVDDLDANYQRKWALLNRNMRWEVADLLREQNLGIANSSSGPIEPKNTFYTERAKRAIDIAVSAAALVATLPINGAIAVATLSTLGRPVFFKQQRLGKDGELFTLVKFRNMREAYDENGHPLPGPQRVTKLGKFMRRTSLDELLNFWSIFKGDMSLIGPRPLVPEYLDRYSDRHRSRMAVKPGLEIPARSSSVAIETYQDQFENDVWYVENISFKTDAQMLLRLVSAVLDRRASKRRSGANKGSFMGYGEDGRVVDSAHVPMAILDQVLADNDLRVNSTDGDG